MKQSLFTLEHARQLTADTYELVLSGDTSAVTAPGQFVNIQLPGKFLRRPISICNWTEDALLLLVRVVGEGTHDLVRCVPGTELDVLSGLGNGFDLAKGGAAPHPAGRRHRHRAAVRPGPADAGGGRHPHGGPGLPVREGRLLSGGVLQAGLPPAGGHGGRKSGHQGLCDRPGPPRAGVRLRLRLRPHSHAEGGPRPCTSSPAGSSASRPGWAAASAPAWAAPCPR